MTTMIARPSGARTKKTTRLAFYVGLKSRNDHALIGDRLICWVTDHWLSHVELVESMGTTSLGNVWAWMLSSSLRDGGVREAWRVLVPSRWVVVEFDGDPCEAIAYIRGRIGTPYGLLDLLSFLLPFRVSWSGWDFCSEVISAALRLPKPWHQSPGNLFDWAMLQPSARIVPDDELLIPWSAS